MTRKSYSLIPVILAVIALPQLFFWWLAPSSAEAHTTVLIGGTILTTGLPLAFFMPYWFRDLRTTAGIAVVSGILELLVIVVSALLLAFDSSIRTAAFAYIIATLICLIVLIPMISFSIRLQRQGAYPDNFIMEPESRLIPSPCNVINPEDNTQIREPVSAYEPAASPRGPRPLPPRNR